MTVVNKTHMLNVVRRAYGPDFAESVRDKLPDHLDLAKPEDMARLAELGLTPEGLVGALGGEY
ncbi:hypothetical protein [Actinoplanes solisilvae]|uniref:hypothetical protein n=1 Tax=Actinoplanes solisilvae TaxID=2486853 RepID=UPI000FD765BC|nr:hypothetical protein [Actinoplanes solisilvae]